MLLCCHAMLPPKQLDEAKRKILLLLRAKLNLYLTSCPPFADEVEDASDLQLYWESKLGEAEELSEAALLLHSLTLNKAAVERTFSRQKHLDKRLRCKLNQGSNQSLLFINFNYEQFGDSSYNPSIVSEPQHFRYDDWPDKQCDQEDETIESVRNSFLQVTDNL